MNTTPNTGSEQMDQDGSVAWVQAQWKKALGEWGGGLVPAAYKLLAEQEITPDLITNFTREKDLRAFLASVSELKAGPRQMLIFYWRRASSHSVFRQSPPPSPSSSSSDDEDSEEDAVVVTSDGDVLSGRHCTVTSGTYVESRGQTGGITAARVGNVCQSSASATRVKSGRSSHKSKPRHYYAGAHICATGPNSRVIKIGGGYHRQDHYGPLGGADSTVKVTRISGSMRGGNLIIPADATVKLEGAGLCYTTPNGSSFSCGDITELKTINGTPKDDWIKAFLASMA